MLAPLSVDVALQKHGHSQYCAHVRSFRWHPLARVMPLLADEVLVVAATARPGPVAGALEVLPVVTVVRLGP